MKSFLSFREKLMVDFVNLNQSRKHTILAVDDIPENLHVLSGLLKNHYKVKACLGGADALEVARSDNPPDLVLLDIMMPEMDGYEVMRRLKADPRTTHIPVIFLTAKSDESDEEKGLELGAVDYITKPIVPVITLQRIKTHLALYDQKTALEQTVQERTAELNSSRLEIIRRLSTAAEFKDDDTGMHIIRMSEYSRLLAEAIGLSKTEVQMIKNASPMHDVGKIGVPDAILKKRGKLDDDEWVVIQKHCQWGAKIISNHSDKLLSVARTMAQSHHEKWSGKGYPDGLSGEDIPLYARIVAIADVFDALTSERPYKKKWPFEKAMAIIEEEAGEHFDPKLAKAFVSIAPAIKEVMDKYADAATDQQGD
jgi:putative two-component system response regulator